MRIGSISRLPGTWNNLAAWPALEHNHVKRKAKFPNNGGFRDP
jgi:hypothetical protein